MCLKGLLKGIQANVTVDEPASPHFHKPRPVQFALKEKIEQQLDKQVEEGELIPVDKKRVGCSYCCYSQKR